MRARVEYAICIDVNNREINIVPHDNTLKTIYNYLGCRTFDVVRIDDVNSIYIDDEGLFVEDQRYFTYEGDTDTVTLAGNGLILGVDDEGETIEPTLTLEHVKSKVSFLPLSFKIEPSMSFTVWN
jgi:hypothetical protein|tara:strand:- start:146 stop:520 length:375 start_codon:yes stop_codon:yes gene_type:complete